jgi:hypothetical protein
MWLSKSCLDTYLLGTDLYVEKVIFDATEKPSIMMSIMIILLQYNTINNNNNNGIGSKIIFILCKFSVPYNKRFAEE